MQIELSPEARLEIASLVYDKWCKAYDAFKLAKTQTWESAGKFCPKSEWPLFQAKMLESAQKELDKWARLKDEVCKYSPLVIGE